MVANTMVVPQLVNLNKIPTGVLNSWIRETYTTLPINDYEFTYKFNGSGRYHSPLSY